MEATRAAYEWRCSGASGGDAIEVALEQSETTLWYGPHCFEFTKSLRRDGSYLLRLAEVSRRSETLSGGAVFVAVQRGYEAEERVPRCHGLMSDSALREVEARLQRVLGRALFADAALAVELQVAA